MNLWALLQGGEIVNVITTESSRSAIEESYPDYQVADLWSLPPDVQERYQYWSERP